MADPFKFEFDDEDVRRALEILRSKSNDLAPLLKNIGEKLVDSTRERFPTATAPDGSPWATNTETTILRYLGMTKGNFKKDGSLSKKGVAARGSKRPLTGKTEDLGTYISYQIVGNVLEVGSTTEYSAPQQYGARKGSLGPNAPWGDIPARPFLGISAADKSNIELSILDYLEIV